MSRFDYVQYDETATKQQSEIKYIYTALEDAINKLGSDRASSLALTKLEECYMWCGKQIRDEQIRRNGSAKLQEQRNNS